MSMNSVNINSMSLVEKIKLMQQQKGIKTASAQTVQTNNMNTSIFNNQQVRGANSTQGTTAPQINVQINTNKNNIFSQLNMVSTRGANSKSPTENLYENPDKLLTKQDVTKAQTQLQIRMAKEGPSLKLEILSAKLELRRTQLDEENDDTIKPNNNNNDNDNNSNKVSEKDGKEEEKNATSGTKDAEKKSKESEAHQREAKAMSKSAKSDKKKLDKDSKALNKQMAKARATMTKSGQQVTQLNAQMDQNQSEIDSALEEIRALQMEGADSTGAGERSAFSLKLGGEDEGNVQTRGMNSTASANGGSTTNSANSTSNDNSAKISDLTAKIDAKVSANTQIGVRMNTVQTKQKKAVTTMQHTVQMKSKYYTKMRKAEQKEEKVTDKMLKVEQKISDIAQTVEQVGKITETVGKAMEYAGNAMSGYLPTAAAGRALATAGGIAQKVGKVAQTVGQYGQAAAQTAMSLTYVAQGDIGKALQSAGSAAQCAASAVQSTKAMKSDFAQIDKNVGEIKEKADTTLAQKAQAQELGGKVETPANPTDNSPKPDGNKPKANNSNQTPDKPETPVQNPTDNPTQTPTDKPAQTPTDKPNSTQKGKGKGKGNFIKKAANGVKDFYNNNKETINEIGKQGASAYNNLKPLINKYSSSQTAATTNKSNQKRTYARPSSPNLSAQMAARKRKAGLVRA